MKKKILVVEDNELNLKLFVDILSINGFEVYSTTDGFDVIDLVKKNQPDLILMDIQLHGISGIDIIKDIKKTQELKHIPIIAITAFAMALDEQKIMESGCEGYISKPFNINYLLEQINKTLSQVKM